MHLYLRIFHYYIAILIFLMPSYYFFTFLWWLSLHFLVSRSPLVFCCPSGPVVCNDRALITACSSIELYHICKPMIFYRKRVVNIFFVPHRFIWRIKWNKISLSTLKSSNCSSGSMSGIFSPFLFISTSLLWSLLNLSPPCTFPLFSPLYLYTWKYSISSFWSCCLNCISPYILPFNS